MTETNSVGCPNWLGWPLSYGNFPVLRELHLLFIVSVMGPLNSRSNVTQTHKNNLLVFFISSNLQILAQVTQIHVALLRTILRASHATSPSHCPWAPTQGLMRPMWGQTTIIWSWGVVWIIDANYDPSHPLYPKPLEKGLMLMTN